MQDFKIIRYSKEYSSIWNDFVSKSKNATFLFYRDFMEYHNDRFEDYSLLVFKKDKLIAVLPANISEDKVLYSHQGLSYGGFILPEDIKFEIVLFAFAEILKHLHRKGIDVIELKITPSIYTTLPCDEIKYLMFILNARLIRRDILSVINLKEKFKISRNREEGINRGKKHNLIIKEENTFNLFWNYILIKNLKEKHGTSPVHSLNEITLLKKRFPNNIRQFNVYHNDEIVAGTTIFESKYVAHSQYISGNHHKNVLGSLDFLHHHLISEVFNNKVYFDFGTSNENNGLHINKGLQFWKEGFGARSLTQDFYEVETKNYKLLENIMI
ncbi:GNAT family N-acetyltransferase [Seonamhaeicola sediminis]|uniref:GNAT family N-acetyltransferase n=1 Tax=Seonamhaeicola sediminis TaxID=2528206 RepID=A0A562YCJ3_9FLAO|nr:GNAT family N-acetyltransferase [Seonamhaeicola sediminis]TWO31791.1 GNAT family N-acetyltransferase [Seonamhaeicola sediminis]